MAPSAQRTHYYVERGIARHFSRRSSILERDATAIQSPTVASPPQATPTGVTLPSQAFCALIVILVIMILIVFGIVFYWPLHWPSLLIGFIGFASWRICVWRNKGAGDPAFSEKSGKAIGLFDAVDEGYTIKRSLSRSS